MKTNHPSRIGTKEIRQGQNHAAAIIAVTDLTSKLKDVVEERQRRNGMNHPLGNDFWSWELGEQRGEKKEKKKVFSQKRILGFVLERENISSAKGNESITGEGRKIFEGGRMENIARIAKAAPHKLPEKSSLNLRSVCPVSLL